MALRTLALISFVVLAGGFFRGMSAQGQESQLSLEAFFMDSPKASAPTRLWLKITNKSPRVQVLCRPSWSYSWISDDPQAPSPGEAKASLHGCGDNDHDPFWLLLPGESRLDSYEVTEAGSPMAALEVNVDVMFLSVEAGGPGKRETLSWKGRIADAMAAGSKLRAR